MGWGGGDGEVGMGWKVGGGGELSKYIYKCEFTHTHTHTHTQREQERNNSGAQKSDQRLCSLNVLKLTMKRTEHTIQKVTRDLTQEMGEGIPGP